MFIFVIVVIIIEKENYKEWMLRAQYLFITLQQHLFNEIKKNCLYVILIY